VPKCLRPEMKHASVSDSLAVGILAKHNHVPLRYTEGDLEDDLRAQRDLGVLPSR
jgi:hypothetical protein